MGAGASDPLERRQLEPEPGGVEVQRGSSWRQAASFAPPGSLALEFCFLAEGKEQRG